MGKRDIEKDRALELERVKKEQAIQAADVEKEKVIQTAQVDREKAVQVAQKQQEIEVARKDAERALAEQAAATFAVLLACVCAAGPALSGLWPRLPQSLLAGLDLGWKLAPWLGLGVVLHALRRRA